MSRSKARSKAKPAPITAAVLPPAMPAINSGGGIRSTPVGQTWRNWRAETSTQARERVLTSRFLQEALPFVGYLVSQLPEEALGDGLVPTSESKDLEFKRAATAYFDQWARSPAIDIRRRFDFYASQHMIGQTMIGDGQVFALKIRDPRPEALARPLSDKKFRRLQLQFLTRDQLGNAGARDMVANGTSLVWDNGIQFDSLDVARKYSIIKQTSPGILAGSSYEIKDASEMLHIYADRMFNQRHGTPWLFSGNSSALDALDRKSVRMYASKIRAYFLGAIKTPTGENPASMRSAVRKGTKLNEEGAAVDNGVRYVELAGGVSIPVLKEGESINFYQNQDPVTADQLLQELWTELVFCLKYPPEYLLNLMGLGSGAIRMVLRKVKKAHDRIRRPVRQQYCQEVWEFVIGDAIQQKLLPLVDDWRDVNWKGGVDPSIDAGRDEKAEQEKLRSFTGTVEQYCDALGLDGESVRHARLDEIADNIAYGAKKGLPWFMCIDALQVQAMTGLASQLGVDIGDLVAKLTTVKE
ncbi:phage portal protein [Prosthecobacter dejongeii]|uniref:Capsid protein n=1 Tax=Prosthecobacter dejongeii TaxID=48465 RepID=A0A7W8DQU5_9BACT|nr:phage portal protein [Prosthecobacter dejongeii]MBB5038256.1 capsid protein [Prosthecobacter dejongeii]